MNCWPPRAAVAWADLGTLWLVPPAELAASGEARLADAVVLDLGGEPLDALGGGRLAPLVAGARSRGCRHMLARLSPLAAARADAELDAILPARLDGVVLSGCDDRAALEGCAAKLAVREAEQGWPPGAVAILAEPGPGGLLRLGELARAGERLAGLVLGGAALADPTLEAVPRALVLLAAAAAGVPAFEGRIGAAASAQDRLRRARADGFAGLVVTGPGGAHGRPAP